MPGFQEGTATDTFTPLTASPSKARLVWVLAGCFVAFIVLAGCLPVLVGKAVPLWDARDYFGPLFSLVADHAKSGRLMLWDPWINGGSPDFAEPQLGSASPGLLAFALFCPSPFSGFIAYWIAVWIFGGIGTILLCKHLGAPVWGAAVVALGFIACGVYTGNAEHTSWIYSFSFLPWIVWRFDKGLLERKYWFVVQAGVLWGLSAQGGYPGVVIADSLYLALWAIGRLCTSPTESSYAGGDGVGSRVSQFVKATVLLVIFAVSVMGPAYFSFARENQGYTFRAGPLDRQFSLSSGVLPPAAYATLASPSLYQLHLPDHRFIWPETDLSMTNIYMGILIIVLALAALARPSRWRIWLFLMLVFLGCCAVGSHLPVRGWLYDWIPPTRYFRMPSLFRMYVVSLAGVLAAYATRDLEESYLVPHGRSRVALFVISALTGIAAIMAYSATLHNVHQNIAAQPYASFHLLLTWSAAVAISFFSWRAKLPRKVWVASLVVLATFDAISTLYICNPTVYTYAGAPEWHATSARHISSLNLTSKGWERSFTPPEPLGTLFNDRNVSPKIATFCNRTPLKNTFFQNYLDDAELSRIALGKQRIWFSDRPVWLPPTGGNFAAFARTSHALGLPPLVLHSPGEMRSASNTSPGKSTTDSSWTNSVQAMSPAIADLVLYLPNVLTFRYHADRDGWLLVTDRWADAWTVQVNGYPRQVLGGDFIFRAVAVDRGDNLVQFRFAPHGYLMWVGLSWSVLLLVLVWQLWMFVVKAGGPGNHR